MLLDPSKQEVITKLVDTHLSSGQPISFWVTSNSMHPLMQIGDAIIAETSSLKNIRLGDLLILKRENYYLTHRLISKSGKKWYTKGDNNIMPDPPFLVNEITGKVIQIQRSDKIIDLETRKWSTINSVMSKLSFLEWKSFTIHRNFRVPFRLLIKFIQKIIMPA